MEGERVAEGDVLARLEAAPYRLAVEQARAAVEVSRARLARTQAGFRREDIAEARALLAQRKAALARAGDAYARLERLHASGAVSAQDFENARATRDEARAGADAAAATVSRLVSGTRAEDIAVARAELAQAEAALAVAELQLVDTEVKAPSAGVVVTRAVEPGTIVAAGTPALVVAFEDPVWIRAFVGERDLGIVAPGTLVDVFTDSRPGIPYRGRIGYVATQAEFTPKSVETEELRTSLVYRFRAIVEVHDGGLRQGMPVTIRVVPGSTPTAADKRAPGSG